MYKITTIIWQLLTITLLLMSSNLASQSNIPYNSPCGLNNWRLLWNDEFDFLDATKWHIFDNDDADGDLGSVRIDDNVSVVSGMLKLKVKKENYQCPIDANGTTAYGCKSQSISSNPSYYYYKYTSGSVKSKCTNQFTYGYIEARIKFPVEDGTWSALWTYKTDCYPSPNGANEIDIAEIWGRHNPVSCANPFEEDFYHNGEDKYCTNVHLNYSTDPDRNDNHYFNSGTLSNWHIYGLYYTNSELQFYFDGNLIRTMNNPGVFDPVSLILGTGVEQIYSSDQSKYANFTNNTLSMDIDWIRVYQLKNPLQVINLKKPYLVNAKDDLNNNGKKQITVMWQYPTGYYGLSHNYIEWGTTNAYGNSAVVYNNIMVDNLNTYTITNLLPNTKYFYKITDNGNAYVLYGEFLTPPDNNSSQIYFYANGAKTPDNAQSINYYDQICGEISSQIMNNPASQSFLIHTNGFVTADNKEFWRDEFFKDNTLTSFLRSRMTIIGGITNYERKEKCLDYNDQIINDKPDGIGQNFRMYLPFNYSNPYLNSNQDFEYNHSMDYGPVHICFPELEYKNTSASDVAMSFIDADLGGTSKDWKVMSFGFPLKSLNGEKLDQYATVLQKAKNNGVQLVLMGGENYYAHWVEDGIRFLILGNGGSTTNGIDDQKIGNDNQLVCSSTVPHFAKFKIEDNLMFVDIIQGADYNGTTKGRIIEKFAIPKKCYITNNQEWNSGTYPIITDFIWVATGGNLKIESEVQLLKDASIKVSKGAVLNLTGADAKLTSLDPFTENLDLVTKDSQGNVTNTYTSNYTSQEAMWSGIELNSYPPLDQLNFSNQGVLYVSNGATIENAKVAVAIKQLMQVNGQNVWKGGGILRADQANFVNNITDIEMYPYQGTTTVGANTINLVDRTRITRSVFKTDNNFLDLTQTPKHIVLKGVRGVLLYGNDFENTNTSLPLAQKGIGIQSIESSFNLNSTSTLFPTTTNDNSFSGLLYGIKTYNTSENGVTIIKGNTFTNCYTSIYLDNSYSSNVLWNTIQVPETQAPNGFNQMPYGIYLDGGTGFKVENNEISTQYSAQSHGIIVNGTGATPNQIYNNILTNLNVGTQAQNSNYGNNSAGDDVGLHFFCNNYEGICDVWVAKSSNYTGSVGIASEQQMKVPNLSGGNDLLPAGNDFSNTFRMAAYDYDNTDGNNQNGLYYYYDANATYRAIPTYVSNIMPPIALYDPNTCPDNSGSGSIPISQLYTNMSAAQIALNSSSTLLAIWKDGGNANLDQEVETTQPWDVYVQFNSLLAESPYLSDEVLRATIENPAFTSLMIKLIMVANPQASRNDEIMTLIRDRIPAMPQSYIDAIESGEETISQLDLLENDVAADYHLLRMIGEEIKTNYRNDTINAWAPDSLLAFVSRQPNLQDKYELATIYLNRSQYEAMNDVMNNISSNFELNDEEMTDYSNFVTLFGIAQDMYQNERYMEFLEPEQRDYIELILASKGSQVSQLALGILMRDNPNYQYVEEVLQPSENSARKAKPKSNNDLNSNIDSFFKLYPNPATDYFTLEYNLAETTYSTVEMVIYDATGRKVLTKTFSKNQDETLIDVRGLSKGMYSVSFIADGQVLSVEKLTIVK